MQTYSCSKHFSAAAHKMPRYNGYTQSQIYFYLFIYLQVKELLH